MIEEITKFVRKDSEEHDSQDSLCNGWYSNRDIFEERSRNNTLHHLSFSPVDIRRYIICTVGKAPLSNPRINLWEYCEVDVVDYMYRFGEKQRTKKSDSFCRVNLSGGNHIRSDIML